MNKIVFSIKHKVLEIIIQHAGPLNPTGKVLSGKFSPDPDKLFNLDDAPPTKLSYNNGSPLWGMVESQMDLDKLAEWHPEAASELGRMFLGKRVASALVSRKTDLCEV
jgi:hypothetical protein